VFVAAKLLAASADASLEHSENADVVVTHALGSLGTFTFKDHSGATIAADQPIIVGQARGRTLGPDVPSSTRCC
jgi:hypothetical protein